MTTIVSPAEEYIKSENIELWDIVTIHYDCIPDFTRMNDTTARWKPTKNASWLNLHREMSSVSQSPYIVNILNSTTRQFVQIPVAKLKEFILTFPTLIWVLLLGNKAMRTRVFRLLVSSSELDFITSTLTAVKNDLLRAGVQENDVVLKITRLEKQIWPNSPFNCIIAELRDIPTAQTLFDHIVKIHPKRIARQWTITQLKTARDSSRHQGDIFYAIVGGSSLISSEEWLEYWGTNYKYKYHAAFDYYLGRCLTVEDLNKTTMNVMNILWMVTHYYPTHLCLILRANIGIVLFYIPLASPEVVDVIMEVRPDLLTSIASRMIMLSSVNHSSTLNRILDFDLITTRVEMTSLVANMDMKSIIDSDNGGTTSASAVLARHAKTRDIFLGL